MFGRTICIMGRVLDQQDGLGVYSLNLLRAMLREDSLSRYVILLRSEKSVDLFREYRNAEIVVLPARIKLLWDQVLVPWAARRYQADIIFNPKFSVPFLTGRPCIFVLQGSDWYVNPDNYTWWDNLYIRAVLPLYCRKARLLLAISESTAQDLVKYAGIDRNKVVVTYASVSPHFMRRDPEVNEEDVRRRYSLPERYILTVARAYHTGHGKLPPYPGGNCVRLVKAYQHYRERGGSLVLVIAGYRIEEYLRSQGLDGDALRGVQFAGFVPHQDMPSVYTLAEFFVLATLCESFGFPIVEAFAAGCPAILPATCAVPEIAGKAARLVDPMDIEAMGDAMLELDSGSELRHELRVLGRKRLETFTWEETAKRTLAAFDRIRPRAYGNNDGPQSSPERPPGLHSPEDRTG